MGNFIVARSAKLNLLHILLALLFVSLGLSGCSTCFDTPIAQTYPVPTSSPVVELPSIAAAGTCAGTAPDSPSLLNCGTFGSSCSPAMAYSSASLLQTIIAPFYFLIFVVPKRLFWRIYIIITRNFLVAFSMLLLAVYFLSSSKKYCYCDLASKSISTCGDIFKSTCSKASSALSKCINWGSENCKSSKRRKQKRRCRKRKRRCAAHKCKHECRSALPCRKKRSCRSNEIHEHKRLKPCIQRRFQMIEKDIERDEMDKTASDSEHHERRMHLLKELRELLLEVDHKAHTEKPEGTKCVHKTHKQAKHEIKPRIAAPKKSICKSPFFLRKLCNGPLFKPTIKPHNEDNGTIHPNIGPPHDNEPILPVPRPILKPEDQKNIPEVQNNFPCSCLLKKRSRHVIPMDTTLKMLQPTSKPLCKGKCFCRWIKLDSKNIEKFNVPLRGDTSSLDPNGNSLFGVVPKRQFHHCKCKRFIITGSKAIPKQLRSTTKVESSEPLRASEATVSGISTGISTSEKTQTAPASGVSSTSSQQNEKFGTYQRVNDPKKTNSDISVIGSSVVNGSMSSSVQTNTSTANSVESTSATTHVTEQYTQSKPSIVNNASLATSSKSQVSVTPATSVGTPASISKDASIQMDAQLNQNNTVQTIKPLEMQNTASAQAPSGYGSGVQNGMHTSTLKSSNSASPLANNVKDSALVPTSTSQDSVAANVAAGYLQSTQKTGTKSVKIKTIPARIEKSKLKMPKIVEKFSEKHVGDVPHGKMNITDHKKSSCDHHIEVKVFEPSPVTNPLQDLLCSGAIEATGDQTSYNAIGDMGSYNGMMPGAMIPVASGTMDPLQQSLQAQMAFAPPDFPCFMDPAMSSILQPGSLSPVSDPNVALYDNLVPSYPF